MNFAENYQHPPADVSRMPVYLGVWPVRELLHQRPRRPIDTTERMFNGLNLRSASDLTARTRIRDAALARFGADGIAGTSIRAVAADAGVSPALVVHHFGSKDGLRRACDEHVLDTIRSGGGADIEGEADISRGGHRGT